MSSTPFLIRILSVAGVEDPAGFIPLTRVRQLRRLISGQDRKLRDTYLENAAEPKLQIGGGWRLLDGWLNTDLALVPSVMYMDATQTFPLPPGMFDFVFSEHMIEHVPYQAGLRMLRESFRVMRPGGTIRLVTPDFRTIAALFYRPWSSKQQAYFDFFCKHFLPEGQSPSAGTVANAMVRSWDHRFIYDEETLSGILQTAGFVNIVRCRLGESEHPQLRNLENEERYPPGLLDHESIAVEARKP